MDNLEKEIREDKKFIAIAVLAFFVSVCIGFFILKTLGVSQEIYYGIAGGIVTLIWGYGLYIRDKKRAKITGRSEFHGREMFRAIPKTWKVSLLIIFISAFVFQFLGYPTLSGLSIVLLFFAFFYMRKKYVHFYVPEEIVEKEKVLGKWSWSWLSKIMYLILVYMIVDAIIHISDYGFNSYTIQRLWLIIVFIICIFFWKKIFLNRHRQ